MLNQKEDTTVKANLSGDIPANYPMCLHADCPVAASCLHQLAFRRHEELGLYLHLLNPARCTRQPDCPHYCNSQPVRFARGFTNFQKNMYPQQYQKFMTILIGHFGRNQYFKRRRGDVLLSPEDQRVIKLVLERVGVTHPIDFDHYADDIHWIP